MNILEGRPGVRAAIYWINTIAVALLAIATAWFANSGSGEVPQIIDLLGKIFLGLATLTGITAGTSIKGDAIDPTAFPPAARKALNYVSAALSAVILIAAIVFENTSGPEPFWVDGFNAVLLLLSGMLSGVAASHVVPDPPPADEAQPESVVGERLF